MQRSRNIPTIVLFILTSLLTGCTTTEYTLYLHDVNIKGRVSQPPVRTVSFREAAGANTMPSMGRNLHWAIPSSSFGWMWTKP